MVVSDSLMSDETEPWGDTTRIVRRKDAHNHVAELKGGPGGTSWFSAAVPSGATCFVQTSSTSSI
jgi:hypothetical protein